jgi:competence protein ComEC
MLVPYQTPFWKKAPLVRLLLPLVTGIILQWYRQFDITYIIVCLLSFFVAFVLLYFLSATGIYYVRKLHGFIFYLLVAGLGMLLTWQKDSRHDALWYGHFYTDSSVVLVKLAEPLTEKNRSYKADGLVVAVINGKKQQPASGKLLLYFAKDSLMPALKYGQLILVKKTLQPIKNSGNPGAFNYQRYAAFQLVYHQLFLQPRDWIATNEIQPNIFRSFLFTTRAYVLSVLQRYIGNENKELGIAEALLIGYKEDLDKDLVQAYSNTGVVHIIAISGLHLGLIYAVLLWLLNHIPVIKKSRHVKAILLIACLWMFSLLTGGAASVLRSAVMFTVIVIGKYYFKQASVYNSLAASAFILLCYNPYYLWDVGFQLSYLAVIGIIALQQPIYRSLYIKNTWLQKIWQMMSVTIAAQVAAFPICIYYFHQFPNLFLLTNLLVIPLSTIILFGEILLVAIATFGFIAGYLGMALTWLVHVMNRIIIVLSSFSFSVMDNIYGNMLSTWLLYGAVVFACAWLLQKNKRQLQWALAFFASFATLHTYARVQLLQQRKMVIYNISKYRAIDFIVANKHVFVGDSILTQAGLLQNFHLKPGRISMQVSQTAMQLPSLQHQNLYWQFFDKKIIFIDSSIQFEPAPFISKVDVLLISRNASVTLKELVTVINPAIVVFDASNSLWKIENWKKECEQLLLRFHSVPEQGAFIMEVH